MPVTQTDIRLGRDATPQANPQNADAQHNLANVLYGKGDSAGAEASWRVAVAVNPAHADAQNNLGIILRGVLNLI